MDSVTQILLGASVAGSVAPSGFRRRAMLWGAGLGTLPDLDVLVPLGDPVSDFTYHRGVSHSFFFLSAATPLLAALAKRVHGAALSYRRWCLLIWAVLISHALLDCFTTYGTQFLLPFSNYPVAWSTVFIIDPLFTLPLLVTVIWVSWRAPGERGRRILGRGLVLSSVYLTWSVLAKAWLTPVVEERLAEQGIDTQQMMIMATPFNTLAWRVIAVDEEAHYEGFISLTGLDHPLHMQRFSQQPVPDEVQQLWSFQRLTWFARGLNRYHQVDDEFVVTDLRMGLSGWHIFSFAVARKEDGRWQAISPRQRVAGSPPDNTVDRLKELVMGRPDPAAR